MPNNPVQIVLNDDSFLRAPDPGRAGPDKDFFEKHDRAFALHKAALLARLDEIDGTLAGSRFGPVTYVRVRMRVEAIANHIGRTGRCFWLTNFRVWERARRANSSFGHRAFTLAGCVRVLRRLSLQVKPEFPARPANPTTM